MSKVLSYSLIGDTASSSSWFYSNKSANELRYLRKLDFYLLSSAMLGYFIKNLNAKNISTLYLNGMSDYYDMHKNEFNLMQTSFFIGYLIGGFPSKYLLTKFKPRYYLGVLEVLWGCLTLSMCLCKTMNQIYTVRFIIGFLELGFFPSLVYIIGSFYNDAEINKRQLLFNVSGSIGTMITGPLQQFILSKNVSVWNLQKFQILFCLDAAISIPIAIYTLCVNPGVPTSIDDVWYFDELDKLVLKQRLSQRRIPLVTKNWKQYFQSWHFIVFPLLFAFIRNASFAAETIVSTAWIKYDLKLPSAYYNYFPAIVSVVSIILTMSVSILNDKFHGSLTAKLLYLFFTMYIICSISLVYWNIPTWWHWMCYIIFGSISWASPQMFSWVNRALVDDDSKRHFIVVLTNSFDYLVYAFYPLWAWDTRDLPFFKKGFISTLVLSCLGLSFTCLTEWFVNHDLTPTIVDEERTLLL